MSNSLSASKIVNNLVVRGSIRGKQIKQEEQWHFTLAEQHKRARQMHCFFQTMDTVNYNTSKYKEKCQNCSSFFGNLVNKLPNPQVCAKHNQFQCIVLVMMMIF